MRNVKWSTFWFMLLAAIPIISSVFAGVSILRGDIRTSSETEQRHYVATNHKIDSIQHDNKGEFSSLWDAIKAIDTSRQKGSVRTVYLRQKPVTMGLFTQRIINGQRVFVPYTRP